jgi:D-methionine transport system substrate-binding protein
MKNIHIFSLISIFFIVLAGCAQTSNTSTSDRNTSENTSDEKESVVLKIGAASTPHAEILEFIKPSLEEEGITLEIQVINDGIQTNEQTANKELDANFFQHTPFLDQTNKDSGLGLVKVAGIHIEPFGAYSKKIDSIDKLSDGAKIAIPNDPVNFSRALELFAANSIIELDQEKSDGTNYTIKDIKNNPKKLEFLAVDGPLLSRALDDAEVSAINTNYALEAKLKLKEDALFIEGEHSPYVNILVARPDNKNSEPIQKLAKALTSEEVRKFIEEKYEGAVVPAF